MESVGGYAYFVSEGTLSADPEFNYFCPTFVRLF